MLQLFITGIGTGVGKTVVAAILTEALQADYWKPVQSGDLHLTDTMRVRELISNPKTRFHKETYLLSQPLSPHAAAAIDGIAIEPGRFMMPETDNHLIIEGAGGLMAPLNNSYFIIDLVRQLPVETVLVSRHYLGSINHTLLSAFLLKQYNIPVKGIIFVGMENKATESVILEHTGYTLLGRINEEKNIDKDMVRRYAGYLAKNFRYE